MKHKLLIIVLLLSALSSHAQFQGGINDGYTSGRITATIQNGTFALLSSLYKGGDGDGFSKQSTTRLLSGLDTSVLFFGNDGDGFSSSLISAILSKNYEVDLYLGGNGDGYASRIVRVETTLEIVEKLIKLDVLLYPNPASHIVTIKPEKVIIITSIELYDITGKYVNIDLSEGNTINISSLSEGIYLLNIISENGAVTKKLIVKK